MFSLGLIKMESRQKRYLVLPLLLILSLVCGNASDTNSTAPPSDSHTNSTLIDGGSVENLDADRPRCMVFSTDPFLSNNIKLKLKVDRVSLIKYNLHFSNYTTNPLRGTTVEAYKLDRWSRVTTSQGQTLLSLAFNYGVLSMATLTIGTEELDVDLVDQPPGCIGSATEAEKVDSIKYIMVRDFQDTPEPTLVDEERACHEVILENDGYAMFRDRCYYKDPNTRQTVEDNNSDNIWLTILYVLLFIVRYSLFFFGPCLFIASVEQMSTEEIPYVVKLKDTLNKTIFITKTKEVSLAPEVVKDARVVDLRSLKGFPKLKDCVKRNQSIVGQPVKVKFTQYDITVNYRRLLTENVVEVGLLASLYNAIFQCNIRTVGPFKDCCYSNLYRGCSCTKRKMPWIKFWRKVAKASMIVLVPIPYYIRLIVFYTCEHEEIMLRKSFIASAGLREKYETTSSLMHYLTPTHPLFICIYVVYALTAFLLAVLPKKKREGRLLKIIVGSFRDLKTLSWTETLSMATTNMIWPFKRFGMLGCLVCLVYWPIAIPFTVIVVAVYSIPTIYLTLRMAFYSKTAIFERMRRRKKNKPYQVNTKIDQDMHHFEVDHLLNKSDESEAKSPDCLNEIALDEIDYVKPPEHLKDLMDTISLASSIVMYTTTSCRRLAVYIATAILCVATMYAVMIILSEVIGTLVEIVVFTIMGVIVNASALLKYVILILMIFVYCCDCFNNVSKKYLKLNKALFSEVKGRIKNLSDVTSLPSFLQENCGFKAQELSEQGKYESPDDIADKPRNHWMLNDLVMFVDSEDMPRIPKQLFDQVCQIRVAGVPGPVFRGLIMAVESLLKIIVFIVFVFIVVLTFGSVYKVSTTNQMLATLVGGFLPLVLKTFMAPPAPDIEIGTVSFKNKLDEVIKNFCQYWPIYDLPFVTEEEAAAAEKEKAEKEKAKADEVQEAPKPVAESAPEATDPSAATEGDATRAALTSGFMDHSDIGLIVPLLPISPQHPGSSAEGNNNVSCTGNGTKDSTQPESTVKTTRFELPSGDDEQTKVDIVVYMPDKYDDGIWLDEWSDNTSLANRRMSEV